MERYSIEITTDDNVFNLKDDSLKNCDCNIEIIKDSNGLYVKYSDVKDLLESRIQILNLKPNDILIIKSNCLMSSEAQNVLWEKLKEFGEILNRNKFNNDIYYFGNEFDFQIIRKDE